MYVKLGLEVMKKMSQKNKKTKISKKNKKILTPDIDVETSSKTILHGKLFSDHPLFLKYWQLSSLKLSPSPN